jgi:hypothetical protein
MPIKFPTPGYPKPAVDRHIGILSMKPLAARPYSPPVSLSAPARADLKKLDPDKRGRVMNVVKRNRREAW